MKKTHVKFARYKINALLLALAGLFLDQLSKVLVDHFLPRQPQLVVVVPYVLDFRYVENTGAAFGMFSEHRWIFLVTTTIFLIVAIYAFFSMKVESKLVNYALMLIISGGIGNMIDRIFRGYVIDFINITCVDFFVFNIADCCVVIGCCLFLLYLVLDTLNEKKAFVHKHVKPTERE